MAREVFVAMFDDLGAAERARRDLERSGILDAEIELCSCEEGAPSSADFWEWLFARQPQFRHQIEDRGALLAVRAEGEAYDGIASLLLRHDPRTRSELVPDKTSQSSRVRRYALDEAGTSLNS
jgi:hypothetical protein